MPAKKARASEEAPRPAIETARGIDDNIAETGNKVQESPSLAAHPHTCLCRRQQRSRIIGRAPGPYLSALATFRHLVSVRRTRYRQRRERSHRLRHPGLRELPRTACQPAHRDRGTPALRPGKGLPAARWFRETPRGRVLREPEFLRILLHNGMITPPSQIHHGRLVARRVHRPGRRRPASLRG